MRKLGRAGSLNVSMLNTTNKNTPNSSHLRQTVCVDQRIASVTALPIDCLEDGRDLLTDWLVWLPMEAPELLFQLSR